MKNNANQQRWIEWIKKLPDWIKATIGLVTIIIGFVIAFRTNYYLSILVIGLLILTSLLLLFIYLAFAKTPPLIANGKGVYRYEKYRPLSYVGILILIVIMCSVIALRPSRSFVVVALFGTATPLPIATLTPTTMPTPTTEPVLNVAQILLSKSISQPQYRLETTINNPLEQDVLIKGITLISNESVIGACGEPNTKTYAFSDDFTIGSIQGSTIDFQGSVVDTTDGKYRYMLEGEKYQTCGRNKLTLQFDTSFVLAAKSYSQVYILFSDKMSAVDAGKMIEIPFVSDAFCKPRRGKVSIELRILTDQYGEFVANIPVDKFCSTQ